MRTYTVRIVREGGKVGGSWPLASKTVSEATLEVDGKGLGVQGAVQGDVFEICDEAGTVVASRPFRSRGRELTDWSS